MPPLYVQFLDLYHSQRATSYKPNLVNKEAKRAIRLGVVTFDTAYIPASSYFESKLARRIVGAHPLLSSLGYLRLTAGEVSLEAHRESKVGQYGPESSAELYQAYSHPLIPSLGYVSRPTSTRAHIARAWMQPLESDHLRTLIDPSGELELSHRFESAWGRIPEELGETAFVTSHAWDILTRLSPGISAHVIPFLEHTIERAYMETYVRFFDAAVLEDLVYLASPFEIPHFANNRSYLAMVRKLATVNELERFDSLSESELIRSRDQFRAILEDTPDADNSSSSMKTKSPAPLLPTICILTALTYEFDAMRALLDEEQIVTIDDDATVYVFGRIPVKYPLSKSGTSNTSVILVKITRTGTSAAAVATTRAIAQFPSLKYMLMLGIAGAIPRPNSADKDVRLGDVVVCDRAGVVNIDAVRHVVGGTISQSSEPIPAAAMLKAVDNFLSFGDPPQHISTCMRKLAGANDTFARPPLDQDVLHLDDGTELVATRDYPRLFRGVIASGNALVKNPSFRDEVGERTGAMAIEMEAAGVVDAAWEAEIGYLVVRGLVDYCDSNKNDVWHLYAAGSAASVAHGIIASHIR